MGEVVVGVDGSPESHEALRWAVEDARLRGEDLVVATAVHVPALLHGAHRDAADRPVRARAREVLDAALGSCAESGVRVEGALLEDRPVARALLDRAADASTLVVGAHGRGSRYGLALGSVSQHVVVHARTPVVVVPARAEEDDRRDDKVVVGIDGSPGAQVALGRAAQEARLRAHELEVVTIQPPPPVAGDGAALDDAMDAYLWSTAAPVGGVDLDRSHEAERRFVAVAEHWQNVGHQQVAAAIESLDPADRPEHVRTSVISAKHAARALLDLGAWARLLVVGSRGRGGFAGMLLGSVSQQCVRHATGPVMVVPPAP
jgi:nucleotide-binding universal stress UspA family protein